MLLAGMLARPMGEHCRFAIYILRPLVKSPDTPSCMPCSQPAVPFPVQEVERDSMRETPFPTTHRCSVQLFLSMSGSCCICVPCKGLPVASGIKECLQAHGQLQWMPDVAPRIAERPLHAPKVFPEHSLPDDSCHATQGILLPLAHTHSLALLLHCCHSVACKKLKSFDMVALRIHEVCPCQQHLM